MKFSQLIEYNVTNIFLEQIAENEAGRLDAHLFVFCFFKKKKALYKVKQLISTLISIYFSTPRLGHTIDVNCIKFQTVEKVDSNIKYQNI